MMKHCVFMLVVLVFFSGMVYADRASAVNLFASPGGVGKGLSVESPTDIQSVKALARAYSATSNVTVYLRGGIYDMVAAGPLVFTSEDSGRNGYKVVWRNYPGDPSPILSGGVRISGWTLHDAEKNIWKAAVPIGYKARQFWVNGQRAERTRWFSDNASFTMTKTYIGSIWKLSLNNEAFPELTYPGDVELVQRGDTNRLMAPWQHRIWGITTASKQGGVTSFFIPEDIKTINDNIVNLGARPLGSTFSWIENAYEFLDSTTKGQWFLPGKENYIYYVPRDGEDMAMAECWLPHRAGLLKSFSGLSNVTFLGLSFQYTGWLKPSSQKSFIDIQANNFLNSDSDYRFWSHAHDSRYLFPKSAVEIYGANNVNFYQCEFVHLGGMGLSLGLGTRNSSVSGSFFADISSNALVVGSIAWLDASDGTSGIRAAVKTENILLKSNRIYDVANQYNGGVGILLGYTKNVKVLHNDIRDLPYTGISVGWGWTLLTEDWYLDPDWGLGIKDYSSNNEVAYNYVEGTMQVLFDGGAIYSTGEQPGSTIHNNYIKNCGKNYFRYGINPIYYDEGSRYGRAFNNLIISHVADYSISANLDLSRGELSVYNNYYSTTYGLNGYGTPYHANGALIWGESTGNTKISSEDFSIWPAKAWEIVATAGNEMKLHGEGIAGSSFVFGWENVDLDSIIDQFSDVAISNYEELNYGMWRAVITPVSGENTADITLASVSDVEVIAKTDSSELAISADKSSISAVITSDPVVVELSQKTYASIQNAYDNVGSNQTDSIKVKAGDHLPANLYFDRNVNIRLRGGYDDIFSTVISYTEYFGTLTITDGSATITDLIIK